MPLRTFPRAAAAGLVAAALGHAAPAAAQYSPPPTAPMPRLKETTQTRVEISVGINAKTGVTGTVTITRTDTAPVVLPVEPPISTVATPRMRPVTTASPPVVVAKPAAVTRAAPVVVPAAYTTPLPVRALYMPPPPPLPVAPPVPTAPNPWRNAPKYLPEDAPPPLK